MPEIEKHPSDRWCDVLKPGDNFAWTKVNGDVVRGVVTEIDSNVVFIRDSDGREHGFES